jgi:hypothetical protein
VKSSLEVFKMATDKRPTMLRLPDTTYEKIRYLAYVERRSINMQIEHALEIYISSYEEKHGPIAIPTPSEDNK